jgi:hypothetical protein
VVLETKGLSLEQIARLFERPGDGGLERRLGALEAAHGALAARVAEMEGARGGERIEGPAASASA